MNRFVEHQRELMAKLKAMETGGELASETESAGRVLLPLDAVVAGVFDAKLFAYFLQVLISNENLKDLRRIQSSIAFYLPMSDSSFLADLESKYRHS